MTSSLGGIRLEERLQLLSSRSRPRSAAPGRRAPLGGERAEGTFDKHARAVPDVLQPVRVIAEILTVIRTTLRVGAAESEKGWACHHPLGVRNRQRKNWPGCASSSSKAAPSHVDRRHARRFVLDAFDTEAMAPVASHGNDHEPPPQQRPEHERGTDRPTTRVRRGRCRSRSRPQVDARTSARSRASIGVQVHEVPSLAEELAPSCVYRSHRDRDEQRESHPGHQHIGVVRHEVSRSLPK